MIQIRAQDVTPKHLLDVVIGVLEKNGELLETGALITIDEARTRIRVLPLVR